jgi:hypothetical protein
MKLPFVGVTAADLESETVRMAVSNVRTSRLR